MPVSLARHIPTHIEVMLGLQPARVLDIGCGFGLYGALAREYLDVFCAPVPYGERRTRIDAVEVYAPYIGDLHRAVYDNIWVMDGLDFLTGSESGAYDLILLLDVLEHFSYEDGLRVLAQCRRAGGKTLVNVPYPPGPQGTVFGNTHEAHISEWDVSDFGQCMVIEKSDALIVLI